MKIRIAPAALIAALFVTACAETPAVRPAPNAAAINKSSMSLAAQRFDQFCIASIGRSRDGVDLANAYYGGTALPALGNLKVATSGLDEDIGVQYDVSKRGCIVTTSRGKVPNGKAELAALANAYAAQTGGLVQAHNAKVISVLTQSNEMKFQHWDGGDPAFLVETYQR